MNKIERRELGLCESMKNNKGNDSEEYKTNNDEKGGNRPFWMNLEGCSIHSIREAE